MFVWEDYLPSPLVTMLPARIRHADVVQILEQLHELRPAAMKLSAIGQSFENRPIYSATIGTGPIRVLAWSQMHGNEPTHTAVLFDLIDLLQRHPDLDVSKTILAECTLTLVPMLNPDGAERYIRRTAQDLDMNRDALHLATSEARLLRELVDNGKPHFAFNLHNQQPTTSVDGKHAAAVSLIVPPIDEPDTQTEWTQKAKQVAAVFLHAVEPYCEGMISRYDADYMPRCFGEWVQQQRIPTLTVEAGGWSTIDTGPLVQLHFWGMVNALEAIANGYYKSADAKDYDRLPRSSEHYLFDLIVRNASVVPHQEQSAFKADIGINFVHRGRSLPVERGGRVDDFGDLCVTSGKQEFDASGLPCVPGRIVYDPSITALKLPTELEAEAFFRMGVTTVIGRVELSDNDLTTLAKLHDNVNLLINVGFLASCGRERTATTNLIARAISLGVLGMLSSDSAEADPICKWLQWPCLKSESVPCAESQFNTVNELAANIYGIAIALGLKSRATIKLGSTADLLFFSEHGNEPATLKGLRRVMLGGTVVMDKGKFIPGAHGELLLR